MSPTVAKELASQRLGEIAVNCQGEPLKIIEYRSATDIDILCVNTNNILYNQSYSNFKKGALKDYFLPTFFNVGFVDDGIICDNDGNFTFSFKVWDGMLKRCYSQSELKKYPTYQKCYVCDEWLHLPRFQKWVEQNYYSCGDEKMCLDKDILFKNNCMYSPQTAMFVPERINILLTKANASRGKYPIGVYYKKKSQKYVAQVSELADEKGGTKKQKYLGLFASPEEAFEVYKKEKEAYIKKVADYYATKYSEFPKKIYNALYNYKVEITD